MGRDAQGVERGGCQEPGCTCVDYVKPSASHKCDYCEHPPTVHKAASLASAAHAVSAPASASAPASPASSRPEPVHAETPPPRGPPKKDPHNYQYAINTQQVGKQKSPVEKFFENPKQFFKEKAKKKKI
eukprot:TRINITY_DN4725_c0_g1_i1.p1 TRINITY_DN4725_c0_g1~~TRINITY_DN4725_c0_g1_i1.p1  ORF type:complete len:129 (+),score=2.31 TRINITY_DN4725_c0_g1_i1:107-493(+)